MSYADPELRPLLDLEGLKQWRAAAGSSGYQQLERAVDEPGFYDAGATDHVPATIDLERPRPRPAATCSSSGRSPD